MMKHLRIAGMTGSYDAGIVRNSLEMIDDVDSAYVDYEKDSATVSYSGNEPDDEILITAVKEAGYTAEVLSPKRKE